MGNKIFNMKISKKLLEIRFNNSNFYKESYIKQ